MSEHNNGNNSSTPCIPFSTTNIPTTTATWPNLQETLQFERAASAIINDRPHTISSAYEKGHQRPALTVYTFQAPEQSHSQPASPISTSVPSESCTTPTQSPSATTKSSQEKPPLPTRCSSLERPSVPLKSLAGMSAVRVLPPGNVEHRLLMKPTPLPPHIAKDIPQPTYVNMHELANMASTKSQDMNLPPPPVEFTSTPSNSNEKATPNEGERDGSTSESSLESSSGYGSQTTFQVDDPTHSDDVLVCNLEAAVKYCTLPRSAEHQLGIMKRRPLSMSAAYSSGTMRSKLLRRSSVQTSKPPPPNRRTSSITNSARVLTPVGSLENLPPPPAFLLEGHTNEANSDASSETAVSGINVAETVKALTELKHTPASPSSIRRISSHTPSVQITQQPVLSSFQSPNANYGFVKSVYSHQSGGFYAQPAQLINTANSNSMRRTNSLRSQSADRKPGDGPGGVGSNFIAALSAKLTPSLSPRNSRRHSDDLGAPVNQGQIPYTKVSQCGPSQGFLDTLNAKLAQQHLSASHIKANKVRQLINSRAQPDPKICHESLMDQIKQGATLKKTRSINDRSAPKIH